MRSFISAVFILFISYAAPAQELRCNVVINDDQVQTSERQIFSDMKTNIMQFMNTRKWTNDEYRNEERIICNIQITLSNTSTLGNYQATVQIQSLRPVYGTSYNTVMFNFLDRYWNFEYIQSMPLNFNENGTNTNLTSMLAFYAYVIIALDYDSFARLSGTVYLQKAQTIVNNAQQLNAKGWTAFDDDVRTRYWLLENLMNPQMIAFREGIYTYYRLGLDNFLNSPDDSRKKILDMLTRLKPVVTQRPTSALINSFFDAKNNEIIRMFSEGDMNIRQQVFNLLNEMDPTNSDKYKKIISG
jgi:hypothetical protein